MLMIFYDMLLRWCAPSKYELRRLRRSIKLARDLSSDGSHRAAADCFGSILARTHVTTALEFLDSADQAEQMALRSANKQEHLFYDDPDVGKVHIDVQLVQMRRFQCLLDANAIDEAMDLGHAIALLESLSDQHVDGGGESFLDRRKRTLRAMLYTSGVESCGSGSV